MVIIIFPLPLKLHDIFINNITIALPSLGDMIQDSQGLPELQAVLDPICTALPFTWTHHRLSSTLGAVRLTRRIYGTLTIKYYH